MHEPGAAGPALAWARAGWYAAEAQLFPALITDPAAYRRVLVAVSAIVTELRSRCSDATDLLALTDSAPDLIAAVCPGIRVPPRVLLGVASAMLDREFAERHRRHRAAPGTDDGTEVQS